MEKQFDAVPVVDTRAILHHFIDCPVCITFTGTNDQVLGTLKGVDYEQSMCFVRTVSDDLAVIIKAHIMNVEIMLRPFTQFRYSDFKTFIMNITMREHLNDCEITCIQRTKEFISIGIRPKGYPHRTEYIMHRNWLLEQCPVNGEDFFGIFIHPGMVIHNLIKIGFNPFYQ